MIGLKWILHACLTAAAVSDWKTGKIPNMLEKDGCSGRIWVFSGSRKRRTGRAGGSQRNDDSFVSVSSPPVSHDRSGRH